jgi:Domain of unknown function (DUF4113)
VYLRNSPFATVEAFYASSLSIGLPYPASDTAEPIGPATAARRRISRPGPDDAKCDVPLAELLPAGAGQADSFNTRDTDRRRLMSALDTINRHMGRDTVFDIGAGIHRDWKAFVTPAMAILPELRHMRSRSWATPRAQPGLAERIRFADNRLDPKQA